MVINCCGRNIIFDEITGVVPTDTCPTICLTVSDASELPDPPTGCEFAEVRTITLSDYYVALFQWDGASWVQLVRITGSFNAGEIDDVDYNLSGTWTATLNGNEVSGIGTYNFAPAVAFLDIVFTDGACSYEMERVESPVPLITMLFVDTTLLPFDPSDPVIWNGLAGDAQFTDVIITGTTQIDLYGFTGSNNVLSDSLGIFAFGTNILSLNDNASFITEVSAQTFFASSISSVSLPAAQIIGDEAFASSANFSQVGSAVITTIGTQAFSGTQMTEGTHLLCTSVGATAFSGAACATLNFPLLEEIENTTFDQMPNLTSASFAVCLVIGAEAFQDCSLLATINFPLVVSIENNAFSSTAVTSVSFPNCTTWNGTFIFSNCLGLIEVIAPLLTTMGTPADNGHFLNISGNTIDITVSSVLQTIDGGNPDGDLVYLAANNTANIIYV